MSFELISSDRRAPAGRPGGQHVARALPSPVLSRALEITGALQTTLDPQQVIEIFAREARATVAFDGLRFRYEPMQMTLQVDQMAANACSYKLSIENESLGEIVLSRRRRFSDDELASLEHLLCSLLYPLRNALQYQRMVQCARLDPLTGIQNRAALDSETERHVQLAHRHKTPLAMIVIDIDHFKNINDTYGHTFGDLVLRVLAQRVSRCMRTSDHIFRFGGEEFVLLLPSTDLDGARLLAERIRETLDAHPVTQGDKQATVTVSMGVANLRPNERSDGLFERADSALYEAKNAGRNRVTVAA